MTCNCWNCKTPVLPGAVHCHVCGSVPHAAGAQGRTVVSTPSSGGNPVLSEAQLRTAVQRAERAFGSGTNTIHASPGMNGDPLQREIAFFVGDVSISMRSRFDDRRTKLEAAQRASVTMTVEKFNLDDRDEVGLICFSERARLCFDLAPLQTSKRDLIEAIQRLRIDGGTDINAGLEVARDNFQWHRQDVVRRIILLTDGQGGHPLRTAEDLKSRGVIIDVIGVGEDNDGVDERLLRNVASVIQGESRYRFIKDTASLLQHYTSLAGKTAVA